ncbi:MAG: ketopantoate reductase [bacterium]|jgi:ketopantoate reductase
MNRPDRDHVIKYWLCSQYLLYDLPIQELNVSSCLAPIPDTESKLNILMLGASYGSLFATKLALAGHSTTMVCLPAEEELINSHGTLVRLPVRGRAEPIELSSQELTGRITACSAESADPTAFDLIVLAMQEPQYSVGAVKELMERIATSNLPCVSIMNMPPLPFLARLPGIRIADVESAYTDPEVWSRFDPALVTLASPDPQAFRPPDEPVNVLQVGLPTNFKVARFVSDYHTELLQKLEKDIADIRFEIEGESIELPVKLRVHKSVYVPLAKWLMLLTGNYRCVLNGDTRSIRDAVHSDIAASEQIYNWVGELCIACGASPDDLVPFVKYANAAKGLLKPSSAARALLAGAKNIERVDKVVQKLAAVKGMQHDEVDAIVSRVDSWLENNRQELERV